MAGGGIHPEECMPPNVRCFGRQASAKSEVGSAHPKVGPEYGRWQRACVDPTRLLTAFKIRVGPFWNHPHTLSNISES
eukprot:scaffold27667_cov102-Isochrysis_galbana.AAC.1